MAPHFAAYTVYGRHLTFGVPYIDCPNTISKPRRRQPAGRARIIPTKHLKMSDNQPLNDRAASAEKPQSAVKL